MTTHSGQRAVVEQVEEFRYATEYQPPSVGVTPNQPANQPITIEPKIDVSAFDSTPTAFETRNIGVTFEVEPVVSADGKMIELNMVPQHVHFLEWTKVTIEKEAPAGKLIIEQPRFMTNKVTTSLTFRNGERRLVGFFKVPEPAGNVELFILRVDAVKKKVAVEKLSYPVGSDSGGPALR